jgi:hypothetical protein
MNGSVKDHIINALQTAEELYFRLVMLVGDAGSGKTKVLRSLGDEFNTEVINVNLQLSRALLELTDTQRVLQVRQHLEAIVDKATPPVLLDNLEILFDSTLQQDPLRLLQGISRNKLIVASWNGFSDQGKLVYAEAGHPEYRHYDTADILWVNMDGTSSID